MSVAFETVFVVLWAARSGVGPLSPPGAFRPAAAQVHQGQFPQLLQLVSLLSLSSPLTVPSLDHPLRRRAPNGFLCTQARSSPTKAAEMDYLTAALHSKSLRPSRAPAAYVADLFDLEARKYGFLESAPTSSESLDTRSMADTMASNDDRGMFYDVHGLIFDRVAPNMRSMIEAALGLPADGRGGRRGLQWLDVLDLGCGRGTMGGQLKPLANFITGIDLSENAIKFAQRGGSYDTIKQGDAVTIMKAMLPNSFDLVVAADMVPYFGDLGDLFRAIAAVTRPGGLVAFNADVLDATEEVSSGSNIGGNVRAYELKFTGRWSHRRKYVTQSIAAVGMSVLGVRVVKGRTRLISTAAGEIVLEAAPQERRSTIFLVGKGAMTGLRDT